MTTPQAARTLSETQKLAAQMLAMPNLIATLTLAEAMVIVDMMRPKRIPAGTVFITEGEAQYNDYMMLLLEGDVVVETKNPHGREGTVVGAITPGAILGDMSVIDGSPRATTCTATTDLSVAILTRARMQELLASHPLIAAKFVITLNLRSADRVRTTLNKLNKFMQMNDVLREQLDAVMNSRVSPGR